MKQQTTQQQRDEIDAGIHIIMTKSANGAQQPDRSDFKPELTLIHLARVRQRVFSNCLIFLRIL